MGLFGRGKKETAGHKDVLASVRAELHERARARSKEEITWLGSLGINLEHEIRLTEMENYRQIDDSKEKRVRKSVTNSDLVGKRFMAGSTMARGAWHINKAQQRDYMKEYEIQGKEDFISFFGKLPTGTVIGVAAQRDKTLTVEKADTTTQVLTWRARAEGYLWTYGDKPDNHVTFVVGENNCRVDMTDECEAVIADDAKQVLLSFTEVSNHINDFDEANYIVQLGLPQEYEEEHPVPFDSRFLY